MKWYEIKLLNKLFLETTEWKIAWKQKKEDTYKVICNPSRYWLADPLLFHYDNNLYLFCEAYDKDKRIGRIGVMKYDGLTFNNFQIILEKPYHLSFPFVFTLENEIYMIPESSHNKTIELYKAESFPNKWIKVENLMFGDFVDTILDYVDNSEYVLYTYDVINNRRLAFSIDFNSKKIKPIYNIGDPNQLYRAAGQVFYYKHTKVRPLQYNKNLYGEFIRIQNLENNKIEYHIKPQTLKTNDSFEYRRLHTYSNVRSFEAIDVSNFKFNLFKFINKINRSIRY